MDVKSLQYFECACRRRSIARAAEELGMTIQGLSGSLRRLSSEIGVPLLIVRDGVAEPTEYGRVVLACAQETAASMALMRRSIEAIKAHDEGLVRLGAISGAMGYFGEDVLEGDAGLPGAVLVREGSGADVEAALTGGDCELAILCQPISDAHPTFPIASECFYLWVHKSNPLSSLPEIRPSDLDGQTLALFDFEEGMTQQIFDAVKQCGASLEPKFVGEVMRVFELVHQNVAVGLSCRNHVIATAGTDVIGIPMPFTTFEYLLCLDSTRGLTRGEEALLKRLRERAGQSLA